MKSYKFIFMLLILGLSGCSAYGKETAPYIVDVQMTVESESDEFMFAGLNLSFCNKSEKRVSEFTVVFYLFDEEGEPISNGQSNIVISVKKDIETMENFECVLNMDRYFSEIPEEPYQVDYLYISRILYQDGSEWTDPFGMYAF